MQRNATLSSTPETEPAPELSPAQQLVLSALLAGRSITDAAAAGDADRSTVYRWLKNDFTFTAELNGGRKRLREQAEARLLAVANRAAETIEQAIVGGNVAASVAVLKGLGLLSGKPAVIGSDDAQRLREDEESARENESLMRVLSRPFGM